MTSGAPARALRIACLAAACAPCAFALPARAQRLEDTFASANAAAYRGDWDEAARQYEHLLDARVDDPDVHFDYAVAQAHRGELGRAVLGFERALRLAPGDATVREALAQALSALGHRRAEREGEATVRTRPPLAQALVRPFSENLLAWLVLAFDVLLFALLTARRYARTEATRVGLAIAWPLAALACVAASAALLVKTEAFAEGRAAVVVRDGAELREGPADSARVRDTVQVGAYARLIEHEAGFARIRVDHRTGWMREGDVGSLRPD
jgi:tetratricopeptide (TPR) repeat protein